ncbi:MAG: (4Fe-4S)-binding protein [Peptococcaceae bacterium BICA1-7]|nr:MAG: (4Fe-4S)-binding protein [Peptococcaceae bacterium BICA1-7]HBV97132.1 4Fe-4S dicluster domain-containing protein [Desulfotomaculum sp.]
MKEIVVISGKGGAGKTSLAASLAALAGRAVAADCDVDAADLHLVMSPRTIRAENFFGGKKASVNPARCSGCGRCKDLCRFEAITRDEEGSVYEVDALSCEGCGVCSYFCPEKAIDFKLVVNGQWFVSDTPYGPMVHARLGVAEENSGKLVALVRKQARIIAEREGIPFIIVDGPPGLGCPVIASITGADAVLIVTEPTVSGEHDMERVSRLAAYFNIPAYLCVNKYDINPGLSKKISDRARADGLKVLGGIHYDRSVTEAQIKKQPVAALNGSTASEDMRKIWINLVDQIKKEKREEGRV